MITHICAASDVLYVFWPCSAFSCAVCRWSRCAEVWRHSAGGGRLGILLCRKKWHLVKQQFTSKSKFLFIMQKRWTQFMESISFINNVNLHTFATLWCDVFNLHIVCSRGCVFVFLQSSCNQFHAHQVTHTACLLFMRSLNKDARGGLSVL